MVVSEEFRHLIKRKSFLYDTMDWQEYGEVTCAPLNIRIKTHICEQIFAENDSLDDIIDGEFTPPMEQNAGYTGMGWIGKEGVKNKQMSDRYNNNEDSHREHDFGD